jgi:hypothetical protein
MELIIDGWTSSVRMNQKKQTNTKQTNRNTENLGGNTSEGIGINVTRIYK